MDHRVSVQKEDFSVAQEYEALAQGSQAGAVVTFVGKVRDMNLGDNVVGLHLEHYPGMTEKSLLEICDMAQERWPLQRVRVIHRIGDMLSGDQIVLVGVTSAHRNAVCSVRVHHGLLENPRAILEKRADDRSESLD